MSESYREQRPLLSGEFSDEESYTPHFSRRLHISRGRNRNRLKGAAAIITRWPDHWGSFLTYWWIGIGMVCLTSFVIYNSLFVFPLMQPVSMKPARERIYPIETTSHVAPSSRNVFMHLFVNQHEEVNFNEYLPYIEKFSNKYVSFNFHLVILLNVTNMKDLSAEENNKIALNSLWDSDISKKKETVIKRSNINIEYISLTTYMDDSPLKKYWRTMPQQHVQFLARAVSIWNKGGVAFNPDILTPRSPHSVYAEKLRKLLNSFKKHQTTFGVSRKESPLIVKSANNLTDDRKRTQNVNNIRDIIDALENKSDTTNIVSRELAEAENQDLPVIARSKRGNLNVSKGLDLHNESTVYSKIPYIKSDADAHENNMSNPYVPYENRNSSNGSSLLPLFLNFLFRFKPSNEKKSTEISPIDSISRKPKSVINRPENNKSSSLNRKPDKYRPVIISAKGINSSAFVNNNNVQNIQSINDVDDSIDSNRLTVDLRGNIIATDTPCHAFLGTIFINAPLHRDNETVTDFIIAELTTFCRGLLSSCMGIDVILL